MTPARYVAIITDGNGRWAQQRGLPVVEGHRAGADTVKARLRDAVELGIEELTVFSFSTENWSRPAEEVEGLMRMFGERIAGETPELHEEGVRMRFIGRREGVDPGLVERMEWAEAHHRRQRPDHPLRCFQLWGQGGDRRRGAKLPGGLRGGVPPTPLRTRDARSRSPDTNQRRAAHLQLPALAVRLLGAGLPRGALAGLHPRGAGGVAGASTRPGSGASGRGPEDERAPRGAGGASQPAASQLPRGRRAL